MTKDHSSPDIYDQYDLNSKEASSPLINLSHLFWVFKNKYKLILSLWFVLTVLTAVILILIPDKYRAKATILPSSSGSPLSKFNGVASILGFDLSGITSEGNSDLLYPEIVTSDRILLNLLNRKWKYNQEDSLVDLGRVLGVERQDDIPFPDRVYEQEITKILTQDVISTQIDKVTGLITMTVTLKRDPVLAREILVVILNDLENYNRDFRKTKSSEELKFIEKRMTENNQELNRNETLLKEFELKNSSWQNSPELRMEWNRLNRELQVSTTVWVELRKQYELVKLSNLRERVTFDILDYPSLPAIKSFPRRTLLLGIFMIPALFLSVFSVYFFTVFIKSER